MSGGRRLERRQCPGATFGGLHAGAHPRAAPPGHPRVPGPRCRVHRAVRRGERKFRYIDADGGASPISLLDSDPIEASFCGHVAAGRLLGYLEDPMQHPVSAELPVTAELPVGSHLSVPIRFSDGRIYGTFCCFSFDVKQSLHPRDLRNVEMVASIAAEYLEVLDAAEGEQQERRDLIASILGDPAAMTMVFQPLRDLQTMEIVGLEALARLPSRDKGPKWFFSQAVEVGLGPELEMHAARLVLRSLADIPPPIKLNININIGARTLATPAFIELVSAVEPGRLVVEGCDANATKQALIEAFCAFGERSDFVIVAEGIETESELAMRRSLNVKLGQGYHLGRPDTLEAALAS